MWIMIFALTFATAITFGVASVMLHDRAIAAPKRDSHAVARLFSSPTLKTRVANPRTSMLPFARRSERFPEAGIGEVLGQATHPQGIVALVVFEIGHSPPGGQDRAEPQGGHQTATSAGPTETGAGVTSNSRANEIRSAWTGP